MSAVGTQQAVLTAIGEVREALKGQGSLWCERWSAHEFVDNTQEELRAVSTKAQEKIAKQRGRPAMQTLTDALTVAVSNWLTGVLARPFDEERRRAIEFCLAANGADIQLVVRLRAGALVVEGTADGGALKYIERMLNRYGRSRK